MGIEREQHFRKKWGERERERERERESICIGVS